MVIVFRYFVSCNCMQIMCYLKLQMLTKDYYVFFRQFFTTALLLVSLWGLSDNKFPQVSRTLLSILADVNNVVAWIVLTLPLISKSSSPCTNPYNWYYRHFHVLQLFQLPRSKYLSLFSHSFNFTPWSAGTAIIIIIIVIYLKPCN